MNYAISDKVGDGVLFMNEKNTQGASLDKNWWNLREIDRKQKVKSRAQ